MRKTLQFIGSQKGDTETGKDDEPKKKEEKKRSFTLPLSRNDSILLPDNRCHYTVERVEYRVLIY